MEHAIELDSIFLFFPLSFLFLSYPLGFFLLSPPLLSRKLLCLGSSLVLEYLQSHSKLFGLFFELADLFPE